MKKYYFKKSIAIILILFGVWFLLMGECLVDKEWILHNHYYIERFVVGLVFIIFGGYYLSVIEGRMEKYGKC